MRVAAAPHLERHRVVVVRDLQPHDVVYMHPDAVEDLRKFSAEERRRLN